MAYRLERAESVVTGLKRVVCDEIDSAGSHLSGAKKVSRDEAIHEARKSIKKVRALLRLMRSELGTVFGRENSRLRDIAGKLSEFRDAFAIIATFDDLNGKYKKETGNKLQPVRAGLMKKRNTGGKSEDVALVLAEAAAALRKAAKRVKSWPLETDGYSALAPGLEAIYRAGRKALARVHKDPQPDNFHELRKRVKDHWYHVRLLENIWTDMMKPYEKSLKDLETWLGNDHNLAVLRERIVAEPGLYGKQNEIDLLLDLIDRYQKELRDQSLALADRIYEEKPRALTRHMNHLWDTWRHEPRDLKESSNAA
ncbi:MAG: CHAD domain-containing protein [Acidobacteriota bacterium]|nr:CHAD domain-containing protein [Acidobacteriota bacterium]